MFFARYGQIEQFAKFINTRSQRRAVIVACDTNMGEWDRSRLEQSLLMTGLKDSRQELSPRTGPYRPHLL